ncbi:MAG TPA: TRAP transporter small permease [Pseudolabrys sp.]|nr:TRAP transporter small permease [Pseudolabrys sp.]
MTRCAGYGAAFFLAAMMMVTVADVCLRAVGNLPITGAYDLVQLFLVGSVFMSLPDVFLRAENIVIDFIDHLVGPRAVELLKAIANFIAFVFLAVLLWHMVPPALDAHRFHEVSSDLAIPMTVHWALMILGIALSLLPAGVILVASLASLVRARASS